MPHDRQRPGREIALGRKTEQTAAARPATEAGHALARAAACCRGRRPKGLPRGLFLTDARLGDDRAIRAAIAALPRGVGVILRLQGQAGDAGLARAVATLCRAQRRVLLVAGDPGLACRVRAQGVHWPDRRQRSVRQPAQRGLRRRGLRRRGIATQATHDVPGLVRAARTGADAVLLSPVFPTRSHPGGPTLGPPRFRLLARKTRLPVYALGGIDAGRARALPLRCLAGLAAIDGWSGRAAWPVAF